jgi:hypothetical protein
VTSQFVGTLGLYLSAIIATVGFIGFALMARFWISRGGWHVFWYMLMVAWVLDLAALSHFGDPAWFTWLRVGSFAVGMPIVLAWRSWLVFDLQLLQRRRNRARRTVKADSRPADEEEHMTDGDVVR